MGALAAFACRSRSVPPGRGGSQPAARALLGGGHGGGRRANQDVLAEVPSVIPEDKIAEIRERTDLLALVSEYVALKRSGTSFKGLCPFHGEKTPSFHVHPDRGFYHCFGCQASGDAITFFMRVEGQTFPEALRQLAERAGVELEVVDGAAERAARQARAKRERLLSAVDAAAGFFVKMLGEHRFSPMARAELARRGIGGETAERFRLGYAPHAWDELSGFLAQRGFSPIDCEEVGLVLPRKSGDGHYDRFRHRLMFPISDVHGRVVAFSGRALEPPEGELGSGDPPAKYYNSPESPLYHKGELLFGLHEARVELRRSDTAILCEGNFDVVSLSHHGFTNVVAPLGTAFTAAQAKLLRRYVANVVLLFDSDSAGKKAVRAAQPLLAQAGLAGRVVSLPPGEDPDSFLRSRGAEAMRALVDSAPGIVEHLVDSAAAEAGSDARAKADAIESLGPVLAAVDNPIEARVYVERVAQAFEIRDIAAVRQQLRRGLRASKGERRRAPEAAAAGPAERAAEAEPPELERRLVEAFLDQPNLHASGVAEKVQELLTSADLRAILSLTARWVGSRGVNAPALLEELGDRPARAWLERRLAVQEFDDEASALSAVEVISARLLRERAKVERDRLRREILDARRSGDSARAERLTRQVMELDRFRGAPRADTRGTKR